MAYEEKKKEVKKLQKSYFDVLGICCTSEVPLIENILNSLDGVKEYSIIVPSRTVIVVHDSLLISPFQIAKALNQARLEANVKVTGEANFKNKWPNPFAVVSGVLLLLSFLKFVFPPLRWIAVAAVAAGIYPILAKAFSSVKRLKVDINILVIVTVIGTLAMQDFMEAAAVVFLFTIAEWLETRASYKASAVMQSLMSLAPQKAIIAETGEEVEVDEVKVYTIVAVKAGETIPIDGIVVDGNCEVDEKTLTGEAFPVPKQIDSTVLAGTINLNGYVTVKTTALASDCVVAKMAKLVEEAQSSKTKSQRLIDKCSQYYTPAIIIISACFAIVPVIMKVHNLKHWFHLALVVLVSACPCGLILSTPVATFCALTKAATSGLLIKSADYLDTLSKIKIAAFDKTGTITRGEFIVIDFQSLSSDINLRSLLYWVSSVESKSSHPMAATLVEYAKSVSVEPKPEEVEGYQNFPGEGIYGKIDGKDIYIGNKRIASRAGCSTVLENEVDTRRGKTVGFIYVGESLVGYFNLSDACRSGVAQALKELKSLGIKTAMLTGDNQASAMQAQEELGNALEVVHGELLPEDKSKIIQEFKKEGPTAMVGDGINDAPALATADVGISMGVSGSALATQTGHIILMSNDIRRIPQAIKLARRAQRKVVENVFISITLKVGILILAFAGHPLIWAAVLVDVGTCLLVILNSMLLLKEKEKASNKKCYRASTSMLNAKKLESGDNDEVLDLEAGLLTKSQCKSSCCGDKKNQEKVMMRKPSCKTSSGCCGEKKQEDNVKIDKQICCGEKTKKPEGNIALLSSCKKSTTHVNNDLKMKCGSGGCCGNKDEVKEIMAKRCWDDKEKTKHTSYLGKGLQIKDEVKCKSNCCDGEKQTVEATVMAYNLNCRSGCCENERTVKQSCHEKAGLDLEKGLQEKHEEHCKTGCCGDEKQHGEITLAFAEDTDCSSGCCGDKETQSCHEKAGLDLEKGLQVKHVEHCKTGCCSDVKQHGEITLAFAEDTDCSLGCCGDKETQSCHEKAGLDLEKGLQVKHEEHCKTGCCSDEKLHGEITLASAEDTDCSSGCCGDKETQSCCEKSGLCCGNTKGKAEEESDIEKGLQMKNEEHCKSGCCSDEKQTGEITLASDEDTDCALRCCGDKETQNCHEKAGLDMESGLCCGNKEREVVEKHDLEKVLQIKNEEHCNSGCCSGEKQTGEITLASEEETSNLNCSLGCCVDKENEIQICHEKSLASVVSLSGLDIDGDCKSRSSCCRNEKETFNVSSQSCCTPSLDGLVLSDLQVKKDENCCRVKTLVGCGSKCSEREKRHSGKSCCRSYVKDYCGHHHHHHHHHHNHVGAA